MWGRLHEPENPIAEKPIAENDQVHPALPTESPVSNGDNLFLEKPNSQDELVVPSAEDGNLTSDFPESISVTSTGHHRVSRRERLQSENYQKFANLQIHGRADNIYIFTIIFLIASIAVFLAVDGIFLMFTWMYPKLWLWVSYTASIILYNVGNIAVQGAAIYIIYLKRRKEGFKHSLKNICRCVSLAFLGSILQLFLLLIYGPKGPGSYDHMKEANNCHLFAWLNLTLTLDEEIDLCEVFALDQWESVKVMFMVMLCFNITWSIFLLYFCFIALHYFNPNRAVWDAYRHYRRHMELARARHIRDDVSVDLAHSSHRSVIGNTI